MKRLFLAIPLAQYFLPEIRALLDRIKSKAHGVKWEIPEKVHLTLHFFGSTEDSVVPSLCEAAAEIARETPCFEIVLKGIGFFPHPNRPRIVWLGVDGEAGKLTELQSGLEQKLREKGFATENRAFHPHATIGRIKDKRVRLDGPLLAAPPASKRLIGSMVLVQSHLESAGSRHEILETFHFSAKQTAQR